MKWIIVQANIRQRKLSGIYAAIKGKNTGGEMDFSGLECGVTFALTDKTKLMFSSCGC